MKPLRSNVVKAPQSLQFAHFGTLETESQNKGSVAAAVAINVGVLLLIAGVSAAVHEKVPTFHYKVAELTYTPLPKSISLPVPTPKLAAPRPAVAPPSPAPPVIRVERPKLPEIKTLDVPHPQPVKMPTPVPVVQPAPVKVVQKPAPTPKPMPVSLAQSQPQPHIRPRPTVAAVSLGQQSPTNSSNRAAANAVSLGQQTTAASRSAHSATTAVNLGMAGPSGRSAAAPGAVNLGQNIQPTMPKPFQTASVEHGSAPRVLFKPKPLYTAEAIAKHVEGVVSVRLSVSATGAVKVLGVVSDLGYGLGESAVHAVQETRFKPATNASGQPIDWEGVVNVAFQLAS